MSGRMVQCRRPQCQRVAKFIGGVGVWECDGCLRGEAPWAPKESRKFGQPKQKGAKK